MPFFLLWASRARAGPTFKARIMARKSKFAPLQSDPSPLLRLAEGSLRLANAIREQQTKPPPGESENATPAQSAALPASTPPGDSAHEGNGRNGSDKNRVRPDAPRLAGLLPFDAAAALNDLHLGLDNLADVLGDLPFQPKWPNRIVRYSSLPPANLERMLAGLDGFRIELFDPKPQLKVGHIPDGKQTIEWTPDLAHGYRCSSLDAPEQGLDVDDCVFFEIPEGTGAGLLLGCSVAVFLREIEKARADPGGFQEWRDDQIGRWRKVWQHAERFELRMHGGHIQELDAPVWATENLNEVYQRFANLRAKCGGFNSTPPQWAVEKDSVAPVDLKTVRELDGLLWGPGSDCALYRSVTCGTFTADGSALLMAEPFLLPNLLTIDDPCLVWSATVKEPPLPPSCDYQLIRTETDEFGDLTSWKCAKCGHTFSSRYLAPARGNEWIYRACGCSNQWDTWKAAKHAADGEPAATPKPDAAPASTSPPKPAAPAENPPTDGARANVSISSESPAFFPMMFSRSFQTRPVIFQRGKVLEMLAEGASENDLRAAVGKLEAMIFVGDPQEWAAIGWKMPRNLTQLRQYMIEAGCSVEYITSGDFTPYEICRLLLVKLATVKPSPRPAGPFKQLCEPEVYITGADELVEAMAAARKPAAPPANPAAGPAAGPAATATTEAPPASTTATDGEPSATPKPAAPAASTPPAVGDARATPEPAAPAGSTPLDSGTVQIHLMLPPEKAADVLLYARGELEALPEFEALAGSTPPAAGDLAAAPKPAAPAESTPPDSEAVEKTNGGKGNRKRQSFLNVIVEKYLEAQGELPDKSREAWLKRAKKNLAHRFPYDDRLKKWFEQRIEKQFESLDNALDYRRRNQADQKPNGTA